MATPTCSSRSTRRRAASRPATAIRPASFSASFERERASCSRPRTTSAASERTRVQMFGVDERRARIGRRHLLADSTKAEDPVEVADRLTGLHGTDPASVYVAASARLREPDFAAVERALYDDRRLVRMLAMRRTM